jgi:hypothetical protein
MFCVWVCACPRARVVVYVGGCVRACVSQCVWVCV